tara:strand:- start:4552 stop:4713 length:162 start_codon:yes stop_codon:yes gene_type:complete
MKNNENFINLIRELISEEIKKRNPLLESPVKTESEILIESRLGKLLVSSNTDK